MVRVTRAWKTMSYYNSDEMTTNFILLDEEVKINLQHMSNMYCAICGLCTHLTSFLIKFLLTSQGNQWLAIATTEERDRIWEELCKGLVYFVTNFKYVTSPTKFRPVPSERSQLFYRETKINDCCKGNKISRLKFELQFLATLKSRQPRHQDLIGKHHTLLPFSHQYQTRKQNICITL